MSDSSEIYNTRISDCAMDWAGFLDALLCTTCQLARQKYMIKTGSRRKIDSSMIVDVVCALVRAGCGNFDDFTTLIFTCFPGFIPILACCVRQKINDAYKIHEAGLVTVALGCCCPICSVAQGTRELSIRGAWPGGCFASAPFEHPSISTQYGQRYDSSNKLPSPPTEVAPESRAVVATQQSQLQQVVPTEPQQQQVIKTEQSQQQLQVVYYYQLPQNHQLPENAASTQSTLQPQVFFTTTQPPPQVIFTTQPPQLLQPPQTAVMGSDPRQPY